MDIASLLILLIVAGVCGAVGQAIVGSGRGGILVSIGIGFIGAVLGLWIARSAGLPEVFPLAIGGRSFPIVWSILGSALFVLLLSFLHRASWRARA